MKPDTTDSHRDVPPAGRAIGAVLDNIAAGLRLACARPVSAAHFHSSLGHVLFALLLGWAATVFEHRVEAGGGSLFWIWGFISEAAKLQVWLAALAVIAWASSVTGALVMLATVIVYASLPVWIMTLVLGPFAAIDGPYFTLYLCAVLLWHLAIFWRAYRLLPPNGWAQNLGALALYAGALLVISDYLPDSRMFYQERDTASPPSLDVEAVYYRQADLLERELAALAPQDPTRSDLYFIGVGAYASQDVFMREVNQVRALLEQQFGMARHTVSLVNNPETVWDIPLANRHNLERATRHLGRIMDVDEDILFLFLTSHGNEDASVAVEFEDLGLNDIYASAVREALDAAGIRWRVIVVSACYSGGFIDELESPDTIVITAAARDRSSFGCSHENDWTYFGRAYFEQALVDTRDFVQAFEAARVSISEREREEGKEASLPQIAVGASIASRLRAWRPLMQAEPAPHAGESPP